MTPVRIVQKMSKCNSVQRSPLSVSIGLRLTNLQLESVELRRLRADQLFTYKLVFGIIDLKLSDLLSQISIEQAAATNTNYTCPFAKAA